MTTRMGRAQLDRLLETAAKVAAASEHLAGGIRREADLVAAFRDFLGHDTTRREYPSKGLEGKWRRVPGGVDLALFEQWCLPSPPSLLALMEMKVDKLDEVLWDLIKLATLSIGQPFTYLVYAADTNRFDDPAGANCSPIFQSPGEVRMWRTAKIIERWPRAWAGLLKGSSKDPNNWNFPVYAPSVICTEVIVVNPPVVNGTANQQIRVVRVWVPDSEENRVVPHFPHHELLELRFTDEGWPDVIGAPPAPID